LSQKQIDDTDDEVADDDDADDDDAVKIHSQLQYILYNIVSYLKHKVTFKKMNHGFSRVQNINMV